MGAGATVDNGKMETSVPEKEDKADEPIKVKTTMEHIKKDRVYRKRKSSGSHPSEEEEEETAEVDVKATAKKTHLQSNLDADSDFSIDSDSEEEEKSENAPVTASVNAPHNPTDVPTKNESQPTDSTVEQRVENVTKDNKTESVVAKESVDDAIVDDVKDAPKIDRKKMWEKRTVGDVLEGAIQRYFERKLLRAG